jgi:putative transposase
MALARSAVKLHSAGQLQVPMPTSSYYQRNLPHWHPEGRVLFLTWRLHGSLPATFVPARNATLSPGQQFRSFDRALEKTMTGSFWLKDERVATCVVESFAAGDCLCGHYSLHAYVVMPNHVHLLIEPRVELRRITQGIKGATARRANQLLGRTGQPFWQDESFDRWVRTENEFERIRNYIVQNPVSAGLVDLAKDWPWSSAAKRPSRPF